MCKASFEDLPYHRLQYIRYILSYIKLKNKRQKKLNITIKAHDAIGDVLVMKLFLSKLVARCRELYLLKSYKKQAELTQTPVLFKIFKFGEI